MRRRFLSDTLPPDSTPEYRFVLQALIAFHERLQGQINRHIHEKQLKSDHPRIKAISIILEQVSHKLYNETQSKWNKIPSTQNGSEGHDIYLSRCDLDGE